MSEKKEKDELVKVKVLKPFWDKFEKETRYKIGQELEFEFERAQDAISRGLVELNEPVG